jgi:hypothetical protein
LEALWVYFETQRHREVASERCGFWTALSAVKFLMEAEWREPSGGSCAAPIELPGRLRNSACIGSGMARAIRWVVRIAIPGRLSYRAA